MRSITPPNEKDNAYIDNLNNQQGKQTINFIFNHPWSQGREYAYKDMKLVTYLP